MKKVFTLALLSIMALAANATDLFSGSKHVSWADGGIQISADKFASAKAGDKIVVTFTGASDGIEFKVMNSSFDHLAGSREAAWISGNGTFEQFLTEAAVEGLKAHGLEIIGANFTASKVELLEGKNSMKEGYTVWTGYFWADSWATLELYRDGYASADFSKYDAIRIYSEAANNTYFIKLMDAWEDASFSFEMGNMTAGEGYVELPLTDNIRQKLAAAGHWMIQFNKEGISAFNVTDIVLVNNNATGIQSVKVNAANAKAFNLAGQQVQANAKGIVIVNGKKMLNK